MREMRIESVWRAIIATVGVVALGGAARAAGAPAQISWSHSTGG